MPRTRSMHVVESLAELKQLERHHLGTPSETGLRTLRLLKENPSFTIRQVADSLGCSERTIHRWWSIYRTEGVQGILDAHTARPHAAPDLDAALLERLRKKLRTGDFTDLRDIQGWLRMESGVELGMPALAALVYDRLEARRCLYLPPASSQREDATASSSALTLYESMHDLLRSLPVTVGTHEWIDQFRAALGHVLVDIDRITISINTECDLEHPERYCPNTFVTEYLPNSRRGRGRIGVTVDARNQGHGPRLLRDLQNGGFPFEAYHPPYVHVLYLKNDAYLGTLILWRERDGDPVSTETVEMVESLEPFLIFMLSDCVARHQSTRPTDRSFHESLRRLVRDAKLSRQERRIVIFQLLGQSYKEIADLLGISVDTVAKHINTIHRKTDTRGSSELFARYFTVLSARDIHDESSAP